MSVGICERVPPPHPNDPWILSPTSNSVYIKHTKQSTDLSLDSGVDGLKDSPGSNYTSNNNDCDIPDYIVDPETRTTYQKGKFLGKGGFARVHEVIDLTTSLSYACKIIPHSRITKPHHREKIEREISIHRGLSHKHVVGFYKCFEDDRNVYIILENCSRKSLVHVLKNRSILTESESRYYLGQLLKGIQYIHNEGIIHRDLKLGNMLLSNEMLVKIGDFGLATRTEYPPKITICGTPNYIAPEVLRKLGHSGKADIWAVGCILYAMLVGVPPFETSTLKETYSRIANNKLTLPSTLSKSARSLITVLLHPNPKARPAVWEIIQHDFFTKGYVPTVLPSSCCTSPPAFNDNTLSRSPSVPGPKLSQEIKKITSSVSSLKVGKTDKCHKDRIKRSDSKKETLFQSAIRQKITSVLGTDKSGSVEPANSNDKGHLGVLYQLVSSCLDNMPQDCCCNPTVMAETPLFISKWIDYSNKYGFGFQLSDRSVGVLFNDNTRISYSADKSVVEFQEVCGKVSLHPSTSVPSHLSERYTLLRYFSEYMAENLTEGGDPIKQLHGNHTEMPHMRRWVRTPKAIIMQLENGTFQINFFSDHTKIVLRETCSNDAVVTFINSARESTSYHLSTLTGRGCDDAIRERLVYAHATLRDFAELDGVQV